MPETPPWLAAAEAMLNRSIGSSSQAAQLARRLNSTSLQVEVEGWTRVLATMHDNRLSLLTPPQGGDLAADAVISGSPRAFATMLQAPRPSLAEGRAAVTIRGDAQIANLYRQFFAAARPDPEEELSRWIGDAPARRLSKLARGVGGWLRRTQRIVGENAAEYLQEESRDLVARAEIEEFLEGVDELRETADRVEARLQKLQGGLASHGPSLQPPPDTV